MGRPGRYTLSVMAWVAAYAGWSSVIGLVVAAITGDEAREVSAGWSALLTVVGPLVPTLVALWFNDWARDGFPTREQQRARRRATAALPGATTATDHAATDHVATDHVATDHVATDHVATDHAAMGHAATEPVPPPYASVAAEVVADATVARATTSVEPVVAGATVADATTTVAAHPLGVPGRAGGAGGAGGVGRRAVAAVEGGFPVAPLVRD